MVLCRSLDFVVLAVIAVLTTAWQINGEGLLLLNVFSGSGLLQSNSYFCSNDHQHFMSDDDFVTLEN